MSRNPIFDPLPEDQVLYLRPSAILSHRRCSLAGAYWRAGIQPTWSTSALVYGTTMHAVIEAFLKGWARKDELADLFEGLWVQARTKQEIRYSANENWDSLLGTGRGYTKVFPEWWSRQGLRVVAVEVPLMVPLAHNLYLTGTADVLLQAEIDLDRDGHVYLPAGGYAIGDWKTPRSVSSAVFGRRALQPTLYQWMATQKQAELGLTGPVQASGFFELPKRKTKFEIEERPFLYPRTDLQVEWAVRYAKHVASEIRAGHVFPESGAAFESPCGLCEYESVCLDGRTDDLVLPPGMTPDMLLPDFSGDGMPF